MARSEIEVSTPAGEPAQRSNGLASARHIEEIQRARLLAAMARAASERGIANVTVADVVGRAGVSRRTFYEIFDGCEACMLAAIEDAVARAGARVLPVYESAAGGWQARIRAALAALLAFFDEQTLLARLLIVEWLGAGPVALERRRRTLTAIAAAVDEGARAPHIEACLSPLTAEGVVGAATSVLHERLLRPLAGAPLLELLNPLMSMTVLPYRGHGAARQELARPAPEAEWQPAPQDEIGSLGVRLTYRTMCVLAAIAAHPGASNRTIGQTSGARDPGQISKLLRRLEKAGLVQNASSGGSLRGEPNMWSLTARGQRLERSLRV